MAGTSLKVAFLLAGVAFGLAAGIGVGVLLADDHEVKREQSLAPSPVPTSTPAPSIPTPVPTPVESMDWAPCLEPGLCEFIDRVDFAMKHEDIAALQNLVSWGEFDCANAREQRIPGPPAECADWPFAEAIPVTSIGTAQSDAISLVSRWDMYYFWMRLVGGNQEEEVETCYKGRVRAVTRSMASDSGVSFLLVVGPPLDCAPDTAYGFGSYSLWLGRKPGTDQWRIESILRSAIIDNEYYAEKLRYYPFQ